MKNLLLSLFGWQKRRNEPKPVTEDAYDTERKSEPPKQVERVSLATRTTFNRSPYFKHDPLYNKRAVQACRAARRRMGIE